MKKECRVMIFSKIFLEFFFEKKMRLSPRWNGLPKAECGAPKAVPEPWKHGQEKSFLQKKEETAKKAPLLSLKFFRKKLFVFVYDAALCLAVLQIDKANKKRHLV